jgi:hypothetical protein
MLVSWFAPGYSRFAYWRWSKVMLVTLTGLLTWLHACEGCTVWKFSSHGFTSNLHTFFSVFPVFDVQNGSFYVDNRSNSYSCTSSHGSENGWFDFFDTSASVLRPWNDVDAALCRTLTSEEARAVLAKLHRSSEEMQAVALRKVLPYLHAAGISRQQGVGAPPYSLSHVPGFFWRTAGCHTNVSCTRDLIGQPIGHGVQLTSYVMRFTMPTCTACLPLF